MVCNAILTFEVSETEKCYNYSIIDDSDCELGHTEKLFSVHLGLVSTNDQPIQILSDREVANIFTNESREPECCELITCSYICMCNNTDELI